MIDRIQMLGRQQVLADFGEFALRSDDLEDVLTEACRLVAAALGTARAKVLEIAGPSQELLMRAGVGWDRGLVGSLRLPMGEHSSETYSIRAREPVVCTDIAKETRFDVPAFMKEAGVVSLVNVPIFLPHDQPYGLLQVDDVVPRVFHDDDVQFLRTYAMILGPVIDRLHKVARLQESEERYHLILENALDYAIFVTDAENRITDWAGGAAAIFGWTQGEAVGLSASILFTPEDIEKGEDRREFETARVRGTAPDVRWHLRKDGSRVFIEGVNRALHDEEGKVTGFLKIGQDITQRRRTERQLRESEQRLRLFGEAATDALWIREADRLQFEYASPAFEAIYGIDLDDVRRGNDFRRWVALIHPADREEVLETIRRVRAGERVTHEFRIVRPSDGEVRWVRDTSFPMLDEDGEVQRVAGIGRDITAEREIADRAQVLVAELQHRTRNLLGVVRSIADKTAAGSASLEDFLSQYRDRIAALARVNGLLARLEKGERITFGELLRTELAAHGVAGGESGGRRVLLEGPETARLRSATVQTLALALHELATNATKYGAFASPDGRLEVRWRLVQESESEAGRLRLLVDWRESEVADMPAPGDLPRGTGYGRELIERALPYQLKAKTTYDLTQDGVRCTIDLPLDTD